MISRTVRLRSFVDAALRMVLHGLGRSSLLADDLAQILFSYPQFHNGSLLSYYFRDFTISGLSTKA